MRNPIIAKKLQKRLEGLCSEHGVPVPALEVDIRRHRFLGLFARPEHVEGLNEPTILILNPCRWDRESTLAHEFTHYLDWLDGIRQESDEIHSGGFWDRLIAVEHLND